ncbi:MAG: hypothetical protein U5K72_02910 [Balneolaceae bacterium]|nr:hypothetical protein [Balneolaceae bacterium]
MTTDFAAIKPQFRKRDLFHPGRRGYFKYADGVKSRRWIKKYWELEFLQDVEDGYTWGESREKAFYFLTLIEIIAVDSFREIGVSFPKIKLAHAKLSETLETKYPFAHAELMTDGKRIFFTELLDTSLSEVDEKQQLSFNKLVAPYSAKKSTSRINLILLNASGRWAKIIKSWSIRITALVSRLSKGQILQLKPFTVC